ncbi:hypothetical protein LXA43DRAFT_871760, partial [Ganoderma leucocontextum]
WLNDDCINLGAQVIMRHLGTPAARGDPVIFSSFVLSKHHKGGDEGLWRVCKSSSEFWKKDIWIFPIHSNGNHWALAIVYWRKRRIAYFDSLHSKIAFETHVKDVFALIHRLQRLVADHGGETRSMDGDWTAYPLAESPLQDNGYDCGVWILACFTAVLRGYTSIRLSSSDIAEFR